MTLIPQTNFVTMDSLLKQTSLDSSLIAIIIAVAVAIGLATLLATPWLLARLPADYFSRDPKALAKRSLLEGIRHIWLSMLRNLMGLFCFLFGVILILTPGPGLVFMVLGLAIGDFPGKHRLLQWMVSMPFVLNALNWIRHKSGHPGFIHPEHH